MWYKLRIIISHVCLFFSTWGTGQLETPLLFHLNQWAAVWSSFHKWIRLSKVQTLPRSLSCIFCMFSGLRPLVFQQVSRSPADGSSFTPAFAHCFNFFFFFLHVWHLKTSFSLCCAWLYTHKFLKCTFLWVILWWLVYVNLVHKVVKNITREFHFFFFFSFLILIHSYGVASLSLIFHTK